MKKLLAVLLTFAMLFSFAACDDSSKEKEGNNKKSDSEQQKYNPDDKYGEDDLYGDYNEEEYENNSSSHADGAYYIESATDFINGHALILLNSESDDTLYYAVTDLNGNITCKTEYSLLASNVYADTFKTSHGQRILIMKNAKDLVCKDINGNVIYTINDIMASGNGVTIGEPQLNPDGSAILRRKISDIYEGEYTQWAYISPDGEIVQDWFDIVVDGVKSPGSAFMFYHNGIAYIGATETMLFNMNDKTAYRDESFANIIGGASDVMNGYCYIDDAVMNTDGVVGTDRSYSENSFYYNASDYLVLNKDDNCFYDITTGELVSQLPINEKMRLTACSAFKNGYALVVFEGADGDDYFALVDRNAQFKFEPIEYDYYNQNINEIWDGEHILLIDDSKNKYEFYDVNGQEIADYSYKEIAEERYGIIKLPGTTISDGMVKVELNNVEPNCYSFIKYDGKMLFPDGRVSLD